jgi:hypothetical protein
LSVGAAAAIARAARASARGGVWSVWLAVFNTYEQSKERLAPIR